MDTPPSLSLGLQGGGAHGAFQWGVLDRLLEDARFDIRAITATSAGAMNGAAFITGFEAGGRDGAREALDRLWHEVNQSGGRNMFGNSAIWSGAFGQSWLRANPLWRSFETLALSMSPYEFNPFNLNPMRRVLEASVNFEAVRASPIRFYVGATSVRHGKPHIFKGTELTADMLLASACLPHVFQAVEVEGEPYWDGGYLANPPLWPLFYEDTPHDLLLVTLNPFRRDETPKTAGEIVDRLNEISFNAPLSAELRAVAFVQKLIDEGLLTRSGRHRYRRIRIHAIGADGWLDGYSLSSKFNTERSFLDRLKEKGREAAGHWLETCAEAVGERSSVDLKARFL